MSGGGDSRVSIPNHVRKVIQEVKKTVGPKYSDQIVYTTLKDCDMDPKEAGGRLKMIQDIIDIAGKHNIDDVYTMLKDCNMDPDEAAQKLLYIDTFHEVKKKHDRRKYVGKFHPGRNSSPAKDYGVTYRQERVSRVIIPVLSAKENNVEPVANSAINGNGTPAINNGSYIHKLAPEASSTPDTAVVSSKTKNTCAIGTINCEIVKRSGPTKSNSRLPAKIEFSTDEVAGDSIPVIAEAADSDKTRQLKSDVVEKTEISESLKTISLSTQDSSQIVNPNQDNKSLQVLQEPFKVTASEHSIPEEKPELKQSGQKLNVVVEKSTPSTHQPVIFPDHIQVPENLKNLFTFGSFEATIDDSQPLPVAESAQQNDEIVPEPCLEVNISSDDAPKPEEKKVETMPPVGGFQNPVPQRDYSYGFMPHLIGPPPHYVHLDVPDLQNGGGSVVTSGLGQTPVTQAATAGQNPIPLSPPPFPYFRQPYPNYIPYNPYFPHLYLPPNPHLFNPALFPPQPPPSDVKLPFSPHFKQPTNTENSTPNQEAKDTNIHPPPQQGEDQQVWGHAIGRDAVPNLLPNYFYNFPQGHHVAFSPLQHAPLFHSSQPLVYQSQPTSGTVEKPVPPPQHAPSDTTLLSRETS